MIKAPTVKYVAVGFRHDTVHSVGYGIFDTTEEVGEYVTALLNEPGNSDVVSVRKVETS